MDATYLLATVMWIVTPAQQFPSTVSTDPHVYVGRIGYAECKDEAARQAAAAFVPENQTQFRTFECLKMPVAVVLKGRKP